MRSVKGLTVSFKEDKWLFVCFCLRLTASVILPLTAIPCSVILLDGAPHHPGA